MCSQKRGELRHFLGEEGFGSGGGLGYLNGCSTGQGEPREGLWFVCFVQNETSFHALKGARRFR